MEKYLEIERSIITKFRKTIYQKFVRAIETYDLIQENDNIMVCISGGKDSFLLAKCIQEYQKHGHTSFSALYVCMDPGYESKNREMIETNAKRMNIPLQIVESDVFEVMDKMQATCSLCARMRRGFLYKKAKELKCNKIALGHHFDDVNETTLMSMFYGSEVKTMVPKRRSNKLQDLELIRPLYLVKEEDILKWVACNDLSFINCACKMTQKNVESKRKYIKNLIQQLKEDDPQIDDRLFIAMHNVNLDSVVGTTKNKEKHSFIELYEDME